MEYLSVIVIVENLTTTANFLRLNFTYHKVRFSIVLIWFILSLMEKYCVHSLLMKHHSLRVQEF